MSLVRDRERGIREVPLAGAAAAVAEAQGRKTRISQAVGHEVPLGAVPVTGEPVADDHAPGRTVFRHVQGPVKGEAVGIKSEFLYAHDGIRNSCRSVF